MTEQKKGRGFLSGCFIWTMFGGMALMLTLVALRFEIWILMAFALREPASEGGRAPRRRKAEAARNA